MESILTALITGGVTLLGVLIANGRSQAVVETKVEELDPGGRADFHRRNDSTMEAME